MRKDRKSINIMMMIIVLVSIIGIGINIFLIRNDKENKGNTVVESNGIGDKQYAVGVQENTIQVVNDVTPEASITEDNTEAKIQDIEEQNTTQQDSKEQNTVEHDIKEEHTIASVSMSDGTYYIDGASTVTASDGTSNRDGITDIEFEQNVVVNETLAQGANIVSVEAAYEEITKEKAEKTYYVVEEGDTLYGIASKCSLKLSELLELNEGTDENDIIRPGDRFVVTVPKSEISVVVTERKTYEEEYEADIEYVDDDTAYVGTYTVQSEGEPGYHKVTADITYVNGNKTEVKYINEEIIKPAVAKVVASGTITPPTYIKPLSRGSVSSEYGYRWGTLHKGVDWYVGVGTPVKAAASGTVLRAGFYSSYGNCVDIKHSDGSMTRYAHLNSVAVSAGQTVSQGDLIAYSGNTGYTTGPHLHFEIWIGGATVNPLNYVNR